MTSASNSTSSNSIRSARSRVIGVARDRYHVDAGHGPMTATLTGHFRYEHHDDADYPTVGDWVLLHESEQVISQRLERRNLISRRAAGSQDVQAIAANIDLLIIVAGLDEEFNLHRIERYLVVAAQAGVTPMVILTKADLCDDVQTHTDAVRRRLPADGEVFAVNALKDPVADSLCAWLTPGTTLAVVGSSGVGKSTLVNNLAGRALQATAATRADSKGRHTTTSRDLILLDSGACIIDVPGMREIGLAPTAGGVAHQFKSLAELAKQCRFADCSHGWYSSRQRGARRRAAEDDATRPLVTADPEPEAVRAAQRRWAELLRRIFEVDPLACPRCGAAMRIVAFITAPTTIDHILDHLRRTGVSRRRPRAPPRRWKSAASTASA